jgi:hypothetical protein
MNMSDLANMAAQKAQLQQQQHQMMQQQYHHHHQGFQNLHPTIEEESADLKTPTAEELTLMSGVSKVEYFLNFSYFLYSKLL